MNDPELTPHEEKDLARMTELQVDSYGEENRIHEVPIITEGLGVEE